jgi:hypothetical protein
LHKLAARAADDASLALLFKTHPAPGERLTHLGDALAPRVAQLPTGKEPAIRRVNPATPPSAAAKPVAAEGARALQQEESGAVETLKPAGTGGVDPAGILRGLFGR